MYPVEIIMEHTYTHTYTHTYVYIYISTYLLTRSTSITCCPPSPCLQLLRGLHTCHRHWWTEVVLSQGHHHQFDPICTDRCDDIHYQVSTDYNLLIIIHFPLPGIYWSLSTDYYAFSITRYLLIIMIIITSQWPGHPSYFLLLWVARGSNNWPTRYRNIPQKPHHMNQMQPLSQFVP